MKYKIRQEELKVGDEVFVETTRGGKVTSINGNKAHVRSPDGNIDRDIVVGVDGYWGDNAGGNLLRNVSGEAKFILVYDQPTRKDPVEFYLTLADLRERVEELLKANGAVPSSIRVYTISKIEKVEYKISFKAIE